MDAVILLIQHKSDTCHLHRGNMNSQMVKVTKKTLF